MPWWKRERPLEGLLESAPRWHRHVNGRVRRPCIVQLRGGGKEKVSFAVLSAQEGAAGARDRAGSGRDS